MVEVVLFLYLFQSNAPGILLPPVNPKSPGAVQRMPDFSSAGETSSFPSDGVKREADYEEHEFAKRFNALITALSDFASSYNAGHTMNVKKVKAIEKAWRKLEKSEWFRPPKGNDQLLQTVPNKKQRDEYE
jgi:hypothetical protein